MTMLPDGLITGFQGGQPQNPQAGNNNPVLQKFVSALETIKGGGMPAPMAPAPVQNGFPMQKFDDGGVVQSVGDFLRPIGQGISSVVDAVRPKDGVFTRDQYGNTAPMTDQQRFASFLLNTAGGANENFSGAAAWMNAQQKQRLEEMAAERAAGQLMGQFRGAPTLQAQEAMGTINGTPTIAGRQMTMQEAQSPAHIRQMNASAAAAEVNADKVYQVQLAAQQQLQKQLQQIQMQEASSFFSDDPIKNAAEAAKARAAAHDQVNQMVQRVLATPRTGTVPTQPVAPPVAPTATPNAYIIDRNGNLVPKGQ